jgi:hypothetical protein
MNENNKKSNDSATTTTVGVITHTILDKSSGTTVSGTTTLPPEVMNQPEADRDYSASKLILNTDENLTGIREELPLIVSNLFEKPGESYLTKSGDIYIHLYSNFYGSAIGGDVHQANMIFVNEWNQVKNDIDIVELKRELEVLIEAMKQKATDPEHFRQTGEVAAAREELKNADGGAMLNHLKNGGKFALDVAKEVGVSVLAELIKRTLGMPVA